MPFAYFKRLNRAQQAIYLRSDAITAVPLSSPEALRTRVAALAAALAGEERAATEAAAQQLVSALAGALRLPPVRVQVLAVRPHARWGELHGLYEAEPRSGKAPLITLWMRTAKQRRVVAFRTFLRTLLHEVGHHLDYAGLELSDSFHTEGFYARESHLFHQLVTDAEGAVEKGPPVEDSLARLARTPDDLAAAIAGADDAALSRRPSAHAWSAKEIVCHVRDTEEPFLAFFQAMLDLDEPRYDDGSAPERWVDDRQYRRNDTVEALETFRRRRAESLAFLRHLTPAQWARRGIHPARGMLTLAEFAGLLAAHDGDHVDQLRRALKGST
ncbi:MAG TPA: DinB family protein [Methylomirabilota bacterium]|nr:DinB family protein [Methylomirabilota bacterium]